MTEERLGEVESQMFDLFAQLGANDEQLDFQVLYCSAREVRLHWSSHHYRLLQVFTAAFRPSRPAGLDQSVPCLPTHT